MLYRSSFISRVAILAVALPVAGFSASVGIDITTSNASAAAPYTVGANGPSTTCSYGSCTSAALTGGAIGFGGTNSGSYGFNITLADGDIYNVAGTFNNTFLSGTYVGFFPKVTFEGNAVHTSAGFAVAPDTITLDMLQDFVYGNNSTDWSGTYTEKIPLVMTAPGSLASGQLEFSTLSSTGSLIDGPETVGELGPAQGTGIYTLGPMNTGLNPLTGNYLASDLQLTFVFQGGTGTAIGQYISSPPSSVPEPTQTIPAAMGLVGLFLFKARKLRFGSAK